MSDSTRPDNRDPCKGYTLGTWAERPGTGNFRIHRDSGPGRRFQVFAALLILLAAASDAAAVAAYDPFALRGFGTLGLVYNNDGNAEFLRDISQPDARGDRLSYTQDSLLGLQLDYRPNAKFGATLQAVSKYRYDGTYKPQITWAFLSLNPTSTTTLRVGRLGVDVFFRSESLDVGYSMLWARPPVDYYGHLNILHYDGMDIAQNISLGDYTLVLKAFGGWVDEKLPTPVEDEILDMNDSPVVGVTGEFQSMEWTLRLGMAQMEMNARSASLTAMVDSLEFAGIAFGVPSAVALADELDTMGKHFRYYTIGIARETGPWRSQLAISHLDSESTAFTDNTAAYLSVGYRFDRWTPYVMVSGVKTRDIETISSGLGPAVDRRIEQALATGQMQQKTLSLGTRFDLTDKIDLKFQIDRVRSDVNPSMLWANEKTYWDGDATLISTTLDFIF